MLNQQYVMSFGFLLPISAPQNILIYGTGAFQTKNVLKSGIAITIFGYFLIRILRATFWK